MATAIPKVEGELPLPSEWKDAVDPKSGRVFYFKPGDESQITTWERPGLPQGHKGWFKHLDLTTKQFFYVHETMRISQWDVPESFSSTKKAEAPPPLKQEVHTASQCGVCFEPVSSPKVTCEKSHSFCVECFSSFIAETWTAREVTPGTIPEVVCPGQGCDFVFDSQQISRNTTKPAWVRYWDHVQKAHSALAIAQVMQRLDEEKRKDDKKQHTEAQDLLLQEQLKLQLTYPKMCPRCLVGPVDFGGCTDLEQHHAEATEGGSRINNACPGCGFFTQDVANWADWDGTIRREPVSEDVAIQPHIDELVLALGCSEAVARLAIERALRLGNDGTKLRDAAAEIIISGLSSSDEASTASPNQEEEVDVEAEIGFRFLPRLPNFRSGAPSRRAAASDTLETQWIVQVRRAELCARRGDVEIILPVAGNGWFRKLIGRESEIVFSLETASHSIDVSARRTSTDLADGWSRNFPQRFGNWRLFPDANRQVLAVNVDDPTRTLVFGDESFSYHLQSATAGRIAPPPMLSDATVDAMQNSGWLFRSMGDGVACRRGDVVLTLTLDSNGWFTLSTDGGVTSRMVYTGSNDEVTIGSSEIPAANEAEWSSTPQRMFGNWHITSDSIGMTRGGLQGFMAQNEVLSNPQYITFLPDRVIYGTVPRRPGCVVM